MRQTVGDPPEVTDTVAVRVLKGAGVDLVDDPPLPPSGARQNVASAFSMSLWACFIASSAEVWPEIARLTFL